MPCNEYAEPWEVIVMLHSIGRVDLIVDLMAEYPEVIDKAQSQIREMERRSSRGRGRGRGRPLYISSDGRAHTSREQALAANAGFEGVIGKQECQDPESYSSYSPGSDEKSNM